ncbi:MAG: ChaN family lipoprotein [Maricaulaceae bacterium]
MHISNFTISIRLIICFNFCWLSSIVTAENSPHNPYKEVFNSYILIGEKHGVEEQQLAIAALLDQLSKSEKKIGVVMEMINVDQVALYETFRKLSPQSPKDFGYAMAWSKTSWPDYRYYAPIFDVIWARDMALVPGDPSAADQARWRRGEFGEGEYDPIKVLSAMYSPEVAAAAHNSWRAAMNTAHCDTLTPAEADNVARMQMMRDGFMARQIRALTAAGAETVVLIAGRAHIRRDRGVPLYLGKHADMKAIAIVETDPNEAEGETYQPEETGIGEALPYDHIILTSALEPKENVCDRLRRKGLIK